MKKLIFAPGVISLLTGAFLLTSPSAYAATPPDSCFNFSAGTIVGYYNNEGNDGGNPACPKDVDIPSSIGGVPVTAIGSSAFFNKQLTSATIPDSVTSIGDSAFRFNQLTSVTIGNSVTSIGNNSFQDNGIASIIIPNSVLSIGDRAFSGSGLTSVTIPNSVTSISDYAFSNNQLTSVVIPVSITTIRDNTFSGNQLTSVTIPNTVTTIEYNAFGSNQLTSVTIPNSVTSIGDNAFSQNQLSTVTLGTSVNTIGTYAFFNNQLTSVTIPNSVTSIGDGAFGFNQLSSVTFGTGLASLGNEVFAYNKLAAVTVPTNITSISQSAFIKQGADFDYSSLMNVYYTRLYTEDPSNPANLQDAQTVNSESSYGMDINGDGDQLDNISEGGHLINPAQVAVSYNDTNGNTIAPTTNVTGTGLSNYIANDNTTHDLSRYFRIGSNQALAARNIAGYTLVSPSSPHTMTMVAADGNNSLTFVYTASSTSPGSSNDEVPSAPDTGAAPALVSGVAVLGSLLAALVTIFVGHFAWNKLRTSLIRR